MGERQEVPQQHDIPQPTEGNSGGGGAAAPRHELPHPAPQAGGQSGERVRIIDKARDMAYAAKESQDAAIRHKRLARIQRVAGFPDLAEAEEQTATLLINKGNEDAEKQGEQWEEARKRKLENLSRLLLKIDDTRVQISKDQQTKEISLTNEGIPYDEDTKELLNIGRSGFPPLKIEHQKGITEEGEIVFPIEDNMVLVEKYINQEMRPLKRERVIRIMNESDASQMQRKIYDHISTIGSPTTAESGAK